jgi:hypothetical protein
MRPFSDDYLFSLARRNIQVRLKLLVFAAMALALSSMAYADITLTFNSPVTVDSFYSSEPFNLTYSDNTGTFVTVNSGYTLGNVTTVGSAGVTSVDFSGTPDFYVLDNFVYTDANGATHTMTFDEAILQNCNCSIGGFYSGLAGHPVWSTNSDVLTYPNYNYSGYPYQSFPDVIYEGGTQTSPTPEPGTLLMFGSGVVGLAGMLRRKFNV